MSVFSTSSRSNDVAPLFTIAGPNALASTEQFAGIAVGADGSIYAASELTSGTARENASPCSMY